MLGRKTSVLRRRDLTENNIEQQLNKILAYIEESPADPFGDLLPKAAASDQIQECDAAVIQIRQRVLQIYPLVGHEFGR